MPEHEVDEISNRLRTAVTTAMSIAGQMAEQRARRREHAARAAQAGSEQHRRDHHARLTAEQRAAEQALRAVHNPAWWAQQQHESGPHIPFAVVDQYDRAHTWQDRSPAAREASLVIRREVESRYGVDWPSIDTAIAEARRPAADLQQAQIGLAAADISDAQRGAADRERQHHLDKVAHASVDIDNAILSGQTVVTPQIERFSAVKDDARAAGITDEDMDTVSAAALDDNALRWQRAQETEARATYDSARTPDGGEVEFDQLPADDRAALIDDARPAVANRLIAEREATAHLDPATDPDRSRDGAANAAGAAREHQDRARYLKTEGVLSDEAVHAVLRDYPQPVTDAVKGRKRTSAPTARKGRGSNRKRSQEREQSGR